ncbi:MAG: response regulator [Chloroflexi bacterium]|nr:response regulator [Chloroflexota bacterium]
MEKTNPRILIVDDDANLLATMSDILKIKGFEPVIARTGRAALAQIETYHFDVALIDLRLEDISGLSVLKGIREHFPETECILLTGYASQNSAIEAIQMGVYGFFQKPFDMEQVLLSIQRAVEKNAARVALQESQRFAQATVDALSSHLAILDGTGAILAVNRAWREFAKNNFAENSIPPAWEGINYLAVCDSASGPGSEGAAAMSAGIRSVMNGERKEFSLEYACHSPNENRWFNARVTRFPGKGDLRVAVAHENITERKQAEEAVLESEERFRVIFEKANDAIHIDDADDRILAVNSRMCELTGYSREELLKMRVADLQAPEARRPGNVVKAELVRHGNSIFETLNLHRDGRRIPVEISIGTIEFPGGELYISVVRDITERKQAEANLQQRINQLELLYESGLAFSQLLNPAEIAQKIIALLGSKLNWHHTAIRLVRETNELELVAFHLPSLGGGPEETRVEERLRKMITKIGEGMSGLAIQQSQIIRSGNVNDHPQYVATYPGIHSGLYVPLKSGDRMLGVISIESEQPDAFSEADEQLLATLASQAANAFENARLYAEINRHSEELEQRVQERTGDLNRVNADLARAVRVKDEFLASMSHELRTPLTGILGLSEALQLKVYGELSEKQSKTLKNIEESGRHLLDLINDILDLSKIEAGKLDLQFAPCSLADVCMGSLQLIKGMAQKKDQRVYYSPPTDPISVYVDARRLKQMLVNLLGNAIKFTPQNGELGLDVQTNRSGRKIKLTVWDKGIGIKTEDLPNLFKPFVQLDSGLAREYSGTGLGLSLVRRLAELHNGGIEVESTFGEGSRFTIVLPWSPENTTPIPYVPKRITDRLSKSVNTLERANFPLVLFADDNEMVLQMVSDFLEARQYRVIKARSGTELLERVTEYHPNIMLVDIQMPGIGGLETIRRIRSHPDPLVATAPVIAVTALAMPSDREHCLQAGADDYMSKPLKLKALAATIKALLESKQ